MGAINDLLDLSDRLWKGEEAASGFHPMMFRSSIEEVANSTAFIPAFANVTILSSSQDLLLIDSSGPWFSSILKDEVRSWSNHPVIATVFTHGHIDHVCGLGALEEEAKDSGRSIKVIAHENIKGRFDRYRDTAGYNSIINERQFGALVQWPTQYRYPDETFSSFLEIGFGDEKIELHHAKGETDDHTWIWVPARRVLACGDFFIWATPNAGNPQKVQRYPKEWAAALREMSSLGAELLLPGHGPPIAGQTRIAKTLDDAAGFLESIYEQTLSLMNNGASLDEVIHSVKAPDTSDKPYLQAIYDEPEFIVHNIWRLYGGWFDGDPSSLKPAPSRMLADEVANLAGGADRVAARAVELLEQQELRLAGHLAELAFRAAPEDTYIRKVYRRVFETRAEAERSTMAKGIFSWAARKDT